MATIKKQSALDRLAKVGPKAAEAAAGRRRVRKAPIPSGCLTIAAASDLLGIGKVEVRTLVQLPQFAGRILFKSPAVGEDGQRAPRMLIPVELIDELKESIKAAATPPPSPQFAEARDGEPSSAVPRDVQQTQHVEPGPGMNGHMRESSTSEPRFEQMPMEHQPVRTTAGNGHTEMPLALAFERLLAEKDERIADLRSEVEHLRIVLEREQASQARLQALLSLQAPAPATYPAPPEERRPSYPTTVVQVTDAPPIAAVVDCWIDEVGEDEEPAIEDLPVSRGEEPQEQAEETPFVASFAGPREETVEMPKRSFWHFLRKA